MPEDLAPAPILLPQKNYAKDHLEAARGAQFIRAPTSPEAQAFVQALLALTLDHEDAGGKRRRARQAVAVRSTTSSVGAFAADLIHHSSNQDALGFMYRLSDREGFSETLVTSRNFDQLTVNWEQMKLIDVHKGFPVFVEFEGAYIKLKGKAGRYRATDQLLNLAAGFGITPENTRDHFERRISLLRLVTIRSASHWGPNGKKVAEKNIKGTGPKYESELAKVKEINCFLENGGFDLSDVPSVARLFSRGNAPGFAYNTGGRLYCRSEDNWQLMSAEQRSKITVRGKPTVEPDVRASHLHILYGLHDLDLPTDAEPYDVSGVSRDVVKGLFAVMCGQGYVGLTKWPVAMAKDYQTDTGRKISDDYKLRDVVEALRQRHPVLSKLRKGKMDWANLQYIESECFMAALLELGRLHEVAALPVHDSLVVAADDKEVTLHYLGLAYERLTGSRPFIRIKDGQG